MTPPPRNKCALAIVKKTERLTSGNLKPARTIGSQGPAVIRREQDRGPLAGFQGGLQMFWTLAFDRLNSRYRRRYAGKTGHQYRRPEPSCLVAE